MADRMESYCGLICSECEFTKTHGCKGCVSSNGNPFHGSCKVAECAKSRGKRFCGECEHIPCDLLKEYSFDPEHGDNGERINHCNEIKHQLVSEARQGVSPISYCGFHCDFCLYGQWCGGCRSTYNCCSYATISEGMICPNVKCAKERNLAGCYECANLYDCKKGYYGKENEYLAKAAAIFIGKYGIEDYTKALKNSTSAGYGAKEFDSTGSVDNAVALLERCLQMK